LFKGSPAAAGLRRTSVQCRFPRFSLFCRTPRCDIFHPACASLATSIELFCIPKRAVARVIPSSTFVFRSPPVRHFLRPSKLSPEVFCVDANCAFTAFSTLRDLRALASCRPFPPPEPPFVISLFFPCLTDTLVAMRVLNLSLSRASSFLAPLPPFSPLATLHTQGYLQGSALGTAMTTLRFRSCGFWTSGFDFPVRKPSPHFEIAPLAVLQ